MPDSDFNDPPKLDYESPGTHPPTGRFWVTPFAVIFAVSLLVALVFKIFFLFLQSTHRARGESELQFRSAQNLCQIGLAIVDYNRDFGGEFPDSFPTLLATEDITSAVFVSIRTADTPATGPTTRAIADQLAAGGHLSYVYLGRGLTKSSDPEVVVAYEKRKPGHGTDVLFADGYVDWVDSWVIDQIIARAAAGQLPVTRPIGPEDQ